MFSEWYGWLLGEKKGIKKFFTFVLERILPPTEFCETDGFPPGEFCETDGMPVGDAPKDFKRPNVDPIDNLSAKGSANLPPVFCKLETTIFK